MGQPIFLKLQKIIDGMTALPVLFFWWFFVFVFFFLFCFFLSHLFPCIYYGEKGKEIQKTKQKKNKETQIKFKAEERKGHQKTNKQTNNNKKKQLSATDNLTQVTMKSVVSSVI